MLIFNKIDHVIALAALLFVPEAARWLHLPPVPDIPPSPPPRVNFIFISHERFGKLSSVAASDLFIVLFRRFACYCFRSQWPEDLDGMADGMA